MNNKLIRSSNNLSIGIVGLPNIGKSTLFNLLTDSDSPVEDYPFCTINPHISLIIPQDKKLTFLTSLFDPHKSTPYTIKIHDIAGLVKGASEGLGLGNEFLENIRQVDGIIHVIKLFNTTDINLVLEDIKIIQDELRLKDIQVVNSNKKSLPVNLFKKLISLLEKGKLISEDSFDKNDSKLIVQLNLLTVKNVIYLCNVSQETYDYITLLKSTKENNLESEKNNLESEKNNLESEKKTEKGMKDELIKEKLNDLNIQEKPKLTKKIKTELNLLKQLKKYTPFIYTNTFINKEKLVERIKECLNIITYYTCGKKEVKGWTISNGTTANYAGKVIHTDFVDNFIAVDVIKYDDMVRYELDCKKMGKLMIKGKGYVVEEGDILEFKIGTKGKKK